jgi:hypothetical protein
MSATIHWGDIEYEEQEDAEGRCFLESSEDEPVPLGTTRVIPFGRLFFANAITPERVSAPFMPTRYSYHIRWTLFPVRS